MSLSVVMRKYQERMAASGHRGGMFLGDFRVVDDRNVRLLVGWGRGLSAPSNEKITDWMLDAFDGKLHPVLASVRRHKVNPLGVAGGAVELIAEHLTGLRRLEDADQMIRVHAMAYMDDAENLWEVRSDGNNTKYLARREKENIQAILEARSARLRNPSDKDVRFHKVEGSGAPAIDVGDLVRVHVNGRVSRGTIKSFDDSKATVAVDGKTVKLDRGNVVEILQKSPGANKTLRKKLFDYWNKATVGTKWAKQLTHKVGS